jgi:Predicted transcriptional regulator
MYPDVINMQSNEIYTVKIDTEMMFPTIKIGDTVNAVKVTGTLVDGLYVIINSIDGRDVLWIKRLFLKNGGRTFLSRCDNPTYPDFDIEKELMQENKLVLKVFSLMITVDEI